MRRAPPIDYAVVGPMLEAARKKCGLSQSAIGKLMERTEANVSRIGKGAVTPVENLAIYADAVGGDVAVVVAGPDDRVGKLAARMARVVPRLDPVADASLIDTLENWAASWEKKYLPAASLADGG
jgi:hypothetical protein